MKRLAIAAGASLIVALALLLAACDDGSAPSDSSPTRTPPVDPAARFHELEALRKAAAFHVIYDRDLGSLAYRGLEFAWLQDGKRVRWETSSILEDALAGTSSVDDGAGSGLTCAWVTEKDWAMAEVSCDGVPRGIGMRVLDEQLNGLPGELALVHEEEVEFVGFGTILDAEVECFKATFGVWSDDSRGICYTAEGLPLEIASEVGVGGTPRAILLSAKEIRPPPSEEELLTPIIPDAPLGQEVTLREIPLDELVLPSMPIIEDFFSETGQPQ